MPSLCSSLLAALTAILVISAAAQSPSPRPKPYAAVAIVRPAIPVDASLTAFRATLAAAASTRIYAELAPLVLTQGFFWDRDFGQAFDPRKPGVDNLALAVELEHGGGSGWEALADFAAEASAEPLESRPGVVCTPARPTYDSVAFAKLLDLTYTGLLDWAYPRADETTVRAAPRPDAATVGMLGPHFVRLLGFEGADSEPHPGRAHWARIGMPDGATGFVAPGSLRSLTGQRLCYTKGLVGWRIAGYVAGGN